MTDTETIMLRWDSRVDDANYADGGLESVRARLFGLLANRAWPILKLYRGDLYHDALWLREHVSEPMVFYFGVRDTGTSIDTDRKLVEPYNPNVWHVRVIRSRDGKWEAQFTKIGKDRS